MGAAVAYTLPAATIAMSSGCFARSRTGFESKNRISERRFVDETDLVLTSFSATHRAGSSPTAILRRTDPIDQITAEFSHISWSRVGVELIAVIPGGQLQEPVVIKHVGFSAGTCTSPRHH